MAVAALACRVLAVFDGEDISSEHVCWCSGGPEGPLEFYVNCNDIFWWGTGDAEDITAENVAVLEQCKRDIGEIVGGLTRRADVWCWTGVLFCARVRGMRPQGAVYKYVPRELWPLLDGAGEARVVDALNPYERPVERPQRGRRHAKKLDAGVEARIAAVGRKGR